jgi:hypothetical protein
VSVYCAYRWGSEQGAQAKRRLGSVMNSLVNSTLKRKTEIDRKSWVAWELLIERALSIGQRLGYKWSKDWARHSDDLLTQIDAPDTRRRIEVTLEEIRNSLV